MALAGALAPYDPNRVDLELRLLRPQQNGDQNGSGKNNWLHNKNLPLASPGISSHIIE